MSINDGESFHVRDYDQTLLNCVLLADVIYNKNPRASLESSDIKHLIQKLVSSVQIPKNEGSFELKYMICLNDDNKQVFVVFGEIEQMDDYLGNFDPYGFIDDCEDCIHSTIFRYSVQIPIDYFLKKIHGGHEVVFTGHGFGGALASIVATNCLRSGGIKGDKNRENQILSIAFGTPPFVTNEFKALIESKYKLKDRYHFYLNRNDLNVRVFDVLINSLTAEPKPKLLNNLNDAIEKLRALTNDIINSRDASKHSNLVKSLNRETSNRKYVFFGYFFDSTKAGKVPLTINNSTFDIKLLESLKNNQNMKKYFQDICNTNLKDKIKPGLIKISDLTDLTVPTLKECSFDELQKDVVNAFALKFIVNEFKTDIIISIACENIEYIYPSSSMRLLNGDNVKIEFKGCYPEQSFDKKICSLIFSCSNKIFDNIMAKKECANPKNFHEKYFECLIIAHFNTLQISYSTANKKFTEGVTLKRKKFEDMPLDILYVYGLFFVNVMEGLDDAQLRDKINELKKIFIEIDKRWIEGKLEGKPHKYNSKKNKKILKQQLRQYFGDLGQDLLNKDNETKELFNDKFVCL